MTDVADRASMRGWRPHPLPPDHRHVRQHERRRRGSLPQPLRQWNAEHAGSLSGTPLIFCSSTAVYGITDGRWITEEHNVYPSSVKNGLLIRAEQAVLAAGGTVVGWEPCAGRTAAFSSPNTSRRARPSPEPWTDGSITSTGTMPLPPCTCSAPCENRLPAFTT